jgi:ATPase subunit of ABC transporter with duplicated ATPase domains
MQQRLALARAVLHSPELLVLDEPEAGLDEAGRAVLAELVQGRTSVIATHDRVLADRLCQSTLDLSSLRLEAFEAT